MANKCLSASDGGSSHSGTFGMIKPRAVRKHLGPILEAIVHHGLTIRRMETRRLLPEEAAFLYADHLGKPFYDALIEYTLSGPVVLMHLTKEEAEFKDVVGFWRLVMGSTNTPATLRGQFGNPDVLRENAVHGSDSAAAAIKELGYFFPKNQSV